MAKHPATGLVVDVSNPVHCPGGTDARGFHHSDSDPRHTPGVPKRELLYERSRRGAGEGGVLGPIETLASVYAGTRPLASSPDRMRE